MFSDHISRSWSSRGLWIWGHKWTINWRTISMWESSRDNSLLAFQLLRDYKNVFLWCKVWDITIAVSRGREFDDFNTRYGTSNVPLSTNVASHTTLISQGNQRGKQIWIYSGKPCLISWSGAFERKPLRARFVDWQKSKTRSHPTDRLGAGRRGKYHVFLCQTMIGYWGF